MRDGRNLSYSGKFILELAGYDICDENEDGILESGEHMIIKNIQIRNSGEWKIFPLSTQNLLDGIGKTPSPTQTIIPLVVNSTNWLSPREMSVHLPLGIPHGETKVVDGQIKMAISNVLLDNFKAKPVAKDTVSLKATVPGIATVIPGFQRADKEITIQYPVYVTLGKNVAAVPTNSTAIFNWKVSACPTSDSI